MEPGWYDCYRCPLHHNGRAPWRGDPRAQVVFIGEAPGRSEARLGKAFIGPAGKLLDKIIVTAQDHRKPFTCGFCNVVGCMPLDERGHTRPPTLEEIETCRPNLVAHLRALKPALVVLVGRIAREHAPPALREAGVYNQCAIVHPAHILRQDTGYQFGLFNEAVHRIRTAWEEIR